jgi:hypothetical protein
MLMGQSRFRQLITVCFRKFYPSYGCLGEYEVTDKGRDIRVDQPGSCDCSQANIPVQVMPLDSTGSCDLYQNGGV